MLLRTLLAVLLFPVVAFAQATIPAQRDQNAMQGDCTTFGWNLKAELDAMKGAATAVNAAAKPDGIPELKLGANSKINLQPQPSVTYAMKPERDRGSATTFAGLIGFTVPDDGVYRISMTANNWTDVIVGGKYGVSKAFELAAKCDMVYKSVAYEFKKGDTLTIQISGSTPQTVGFIVSKWAN